MPIMLFLGLILEGSCVDSDTSGLFLRGSVDHPILHVLGHVLLGQKFGNGGGESGLPMIDVTNGSDIDMGLVTGVFRKAEDTAPEELVVAVLGQLFQHEDINYLW